MSWLDAVEEVIEEVAIAETLNPGYGSRGRGPHLGMDMRDGDLVENFGNGLGVDLKTGQIEFEIGNSGFDI